MFGFKFLGKTHVPHNKSTADMAPVRMTSLKEVLLPMAQHIGAPATPIVKVGDEVKVGQLIAEPAGYVSSPIYASVSGKVVKLDTYLRPDGKSVPAIRIESDGLMTVQDGITPPTVDSLDSLIEAVRSSGLVGLGGAGFPTSVKLDAVKNGGIHTIIVNGAECEPYITSDTRTMLDQSELIYDGISLLEKYIPSVERFIFGIESNKPECIKEMVRIFQDNPKVSVMPLPSLYPQGAEKVLIYNTTKLVVPEGKLPADVGVLVINVTSLATLADYVMTGMPLVEKCITVDGSAVKEPKNIIAPIGASISEILEFAGGLKEDAGKILFGGPMMGIAACSLDEPISKTTNAITVLNVKDATEREATACIHCGRCVEACPIGLNPTAFSKALNYGTEEKMARLEEYRVNLCMECGCCSFVCPASRPLVQNNRLGKTALREYNAHKASLK
ncbi:MAG: electron transport complex subunit RsxC [Clostridia bacterium]|nr:electron transport complex subunit RsxC [Clostridia bacterium]